MDFNHYEQTPGGRGLGKEESRGDLTTRLTSCDRPCAANLGATEHKCFHGEVCYQVAT